MKKSDHTGWLALFRELGGSLLALGQAELRAFQQDLSDSGRRALGGLALFVGALIFAFWTVGVATAFLVVLLARWLPLWGAALVVTAVLAILATILALAGRARLRKLESPLSTAHRRLDDHVAWWQRQGPAEAEGELADADEDDDTWRIGR